MVPRCCVVEMAELSDVSKASISRFVSFFKGKRERLLADRLSEMHEFKADRLLDDHAIFNKSDVEDLVDTYHAQLVGCLRESLEDFINLSAVYSAQVFLQAEQSGIQLDIADVSAIEDQHRVDEIKTMVSRGMAPGGSAPLKRASALPAIGAVPSSPSGVSPVGPTSDPQMVAKLRELEYENAQMLERYQLMQSQVSQLLQERSVLVQQLEQVGAGAAIAQSVMEQRLGDSSQFKELKVIVKKKSFEVKQLRQCLINAGLPLPYDEGGLEVQPDDD